MESRTYENVYLAFSPNEDVQYLNESLSEFIIGTLFVNFLEDHMTFTFRSTNTTEIYHEETTVASSPEMIVEDNEFVFPCEEGDWVFRILEN